MSKNIKELWKIVHGGILNPSKKTLKVDINDLNKYLKGTATCLITTKTHSIGELKSMIESFPEKKKMDSNYILFCTKTLHNPLSF